MPVVHMDAKKRARQNIKRATRNSATKSTLKTAAKKFLVALEEKDKDNALALYNTAIGLFDRAAARGVIHKNAAARKKSRLRLKLNQMGTAPAKVAKKSASKGTATEKAAKAPKVAKAKADKAEKTDKSA